MNRCVKIELPENIDCLEIIRIQSAMRILYGCSAMPMGDRKGRRIFVVHGEMTKEVYDKIEKNLIELLKNTTCL